MEKENKKHHHAKKDKVSAKEHVSLCNNIAVGVDGSEGSHNAVELVVQDFMRKGLDKLYVIHITDSSKDHERGIQYHAKTIFNSYNDYLKQHLHQGDYEVIFQEKKSDESIFEQINEIAGEKKADLLVLGFRGINGSKNRPDELSKGIKYLVHKPLIPCLVVKEKIHRIYRPENGFKWLVCIESEESKSFKAFNSIMRYIDAESDIVHGFAVDTKSGHTDKAKAAFEEVCKKNEIKNSDFTVVPLKENESIKTSIHDWVKEHLLNENHFIDFIVLGYNPLKYGFNKDASNTTVEMLKDVNVNVFFDH